MKRVIAALIILLLLIGLIFLVKSYTRNQKKEAAAKPGYKNEQPQKKRIHETFRFTKLDSCPKAFRFDLVPDGICFFKPDEAVRTNVAGGTPPIVYKVAEVYRASNAGDTLELYSVGDYKLHRYVGSRKVSAVRMHAWSGNLIRKGNNYYHTDTLPRIDTLDNHQAILDQSGNTLLDLTEFVKPYTNQIPGNNPHIYTGGWIGDYSSDTIAYLFNHLDLIVLLDIHTGKTRFVTTGAAHKYIPYKGYEVKIPGADYKMIKYDSEISQENVHSSFAFNERFIFIRPDFVYYRQNDEPFEMIDVYSKHDFVYLYSIPFAGLSKGEFILDVRCNERNAYILTSTGILYSTALDK